MEKIFRLPGWIILMALWPMFSRSHEWKAPRESIDYKCFTLDEWTQFVNSGMKPHERSIQNVVIDGFFWLIVVWFLLVLALSTPTQAETIWVISAIKEI